MSYQLSDSARSLPAVKCNAEDSAFIDERSTQCTISRIPPFPPSVPVPTSFTLVPNLAHYTGIANSASTSLPSAIAISTQDHCKALQSSQQRAEFVRSLVETGTSIIDSIWPNHSASAKAKLLPLRSFIEEILRRSRTSFSTLQLSLLYLIRLRRELPSHQKEIAEALKSDSIDSTDSNPQLNSIPIQNKAHACLCGRRMFLASLVVASKYLQDRNFSNRAWSKISGLPLSEINNNEIEFLTIIDYKLHVDYKTFVRWSTMLMERRGSTTLPAPQSSTNPSVPFPLCSNNFVLSPSHRTHHKVQLNKNDITISKHNSIPSNSSIDQQRVSGLPSPPKSPLTVHTSLSSSECQDHTFIGKSDAQYYYPSPNDSTHTEYVNVQNCADNHKRKRVVEDHLKYPKSKRHLA